MNYTYLPSNWPGNVNIVVLNIDGGNVLCLCEYYSIIINNNLMGRFTQIQESQMFLVLNELVHECIMGTGPDHKRGRGHLAPSRKNSELHWFQFIMKKILTALR